ncbi:MAG: hypothetical protein IH616_21060 [Gemmatimonadales bacterium]|jgi:hypothetical protein|nr:hypothetical protein [Gemmatimonadales bacterium]
MPRLITGLFLAALLACSGGEQAERPQTPEAQRARDSVLGASDLPGARGVQRAMDVADSAAARRAREDSIAAAR